MLTVESLRNFGADVDTALTRCAGLESLYLRLVGTCVQELEADALGEALASGDMTRAFEEAHKLKGGVTNLALTPISEPVCELTELLRNKTPGDYEALHAEILRQTAALSELMK